jgi:GH24 family phage-related lysozyme (muramidase)
MNIKKFEGCVLHAYPDPKTGGDPWTIGWGSTGPGIKQGVTWTQQQADERLASDVAAFGQSVLTALSGAPTTQGQFDALVSFAYNLGLRKALGSTLWRMHMAHDYAGAAGQFGLWINKGTPVEKGLRARRAAEAAIYQGHQP